jgi:hypothetical protein
MTVKNVTIYDKEEIDNYEDSRRVPVKKLSVYRIVFAQLTRYYNLGKINNLTFEQVNEKVKAKFPNSRFNPYHFAHYKHKFLVEAP